MILFSIQDERSSVLDGILHVLSVDKEHLGGKAAVFLCDPALPETVHAGKDSIVAFKDDVVDEGINVYICCDFSLLERPVQAEADIDFVASPDWNDLTGHIRRTLIEKEKRAVRVNPDLVISEFGRRLGDQAEIKHAGPAGGLPFLDAGLSVVCLSHGVVGVNRQHRVSDRPVVVGRVADLAENQHLVLGRKRSLRKEQGKEGY